MTMAETKDLFVLAADRDIEQTVLGLLPRTHALQIRQVSAEVKPFSRHDAGCRVEGVSVLRSLAGQFRHAILIFDFDGSGANVTSATELEQQLEAELRNAGWGDNSAVIVIEPEIEAWVWAESPHVATILGWSDVQNLSGWLQLEGFMKSSGAKPEDPKNAMEAALKHVRKKPSSSIFKELAEKVALKGCTDRSFNKFVSTLQLWFPTET